MPTDVPTRTDLEHGCIPVDGDSDRDGLSGESGQFASDITLGRDPRCALERAELARPVVHALLFAPG